VLVSGNPATPSPTSNTLNTLQKWNLGSPIPGGAALGDSSIIETATAIYVGLPLYVQGQLIAGTPGSPNTNAIGANTFGTLQKWIVGVSDPSGQPLADSAISESGGQINVSLPLYVQGTQVAAAPGNFIELESGAGHIELESASGSILLEY